MKTSHPGLSYRVFVAVALVLLQACNEPPLYETRARNFLEGNDVPEATIERLVRRQPLSDAEVEQMASYRKVIPVLHLLGANPATPELMMRQLAEHPSFEVRTGVAGNPKAPLDLLLSLRVPGKYHTVNHYLARNPAMPHDMLMNMYRAGEATELGFAMNPNCPPELMPSLAASEHELTRYWLARNPGLPETLRRSLLQDDSERVREAAQAGLESKS